MSICSCNCIFQKLTPHQNTTHSTVKPGQLKRYLAEGVGFLDVSEHVLDQGVQDVQAVYPVSFRDGKVEADQGQSVRFGYAQGWVQRSYEVR